MRLGAPVFMERDEAEKIARRTFKLTSVNRAWDHSVAEGASELLVLNYLRVRRGPMHLPWFDNSPVRRYFSG